MYTKCGRGSCEAWKERSGVSEGIGRDVTACQHIYTYP